MIEEHDVSSRTTGPWQRATSTWEVSDEDGDLETVTSEMRDGDGNVVDSETSNVSGSSASGEHELRSRQGGEEDVKLTVTDENGNTDTNVEPL